MLSDGNVVLGDPSYAHINIYTSQGHLGDFVQQFGSAEVDWQWTVNGIKCSL